jgi:carboxylesterase
MADAVEPTSPFHFEGDNGDAVVLVHGYTGHPGHFRPLADRLTAIGYTVIAPVLAGHRGSPEEMAEAGWREWVESVEAAASAVSDHRRVHLVGLSLGGLLSIIVAGPTAAASIVTINSPVLLYRLRAYLAPVARHLIPAYPAEIEPPPDPELADLWIQHPEHSTAAVAALVTTIGRAWVAAGRLRRPSLVIQSRDDRTVRPVSGSLLARRLGARLDWIGGAHNALLDPSRQVLHEKVVEHLEEVRRGGRTYGNRH